MVDGPNESSLELVTELAYRLPVGAIEGVCEELLAWPADRALTEFRSDRITDAEARRMFDDLVGCWRAGQGNPAESLAWALRGACAADESWRRSQHSELIWTGPAAASGVLRRTEQALLEVIGKARRELWLVSFAGYKLPTVRDALLGAVQRGVELRLVIESPEASQGKVTFSLLEGLGGNLAEVASVYIWPMEKREKNDKGKHGTLHVKCALADDAMLYVSSANLTEHAMNLNMELGLLVRGGPLPTRFREHLRWLVREKVLQRAESP